MQMFINGKWIDKAEKLEVKNPFNNKTIDTVPVANEQDINSAVESAKIGLTEIGKFSSYERYEILLKIANIIKDKREEFAKTISNESGKTIREANRSRQGSPDIHNLC